MTSPFATREPRLLRFSLGLFALVALAMLLATAWIRFFVPQRQAPRLRDVSWLSPPPQQPPAR